MKNFFVFLFACCAQAVSAHIAFFCATCANAPSGTNIENIKKTVFMVFLVLKCHMVLWHKCTNFIYERRVPIFIIYHNVH